MELRDLLEPISEAASSASSLAPSLIGAALAQAWKPALPWRQRFIQWIAGSTVSFYASGAIVAVLGWNEFVAQAIAFGIALIAFDATPKICTAATTALAKVPGALVARIFPEKD